MQVYEIRHYLTQNDADIDRACEYWADWQKRS
jgi:hypothetical protein